ncbi:hypothetical protein NGRA_2836 [Nosema granulosis]|uniref:ISXO2-like transposase domain-containing protein n=1 Tax=Nosema granulosis TaxID=83296 RepID=A0A9P6GZ37_9MICR|nr:hypothetical protein NGRA_2836 [Nosema granulosis]
MKSLEETFTSLDIYDECFRSKEGAIIFLLDHGFLRPSIPCDRCLNLTHPYVMTISTTHPSNPAKKKKIYRCRNKSCRSKASLKKGFRFGIVSVDYNKILRAVYCWIYNFHIYQAIDLCKISKNIYLKIKDLIMETIGEQIEEMNMIGGEGIKVQFEETAICNGVIISDSSNAYDEIPGITWIIGGVVEGNFREFVLEILPNRKASTIEDFMRRRFHPGTICITDGYPSYPLAVRNFGSEHYVVNHSQGFITSDGVHTLTTLKLCGLILKQSTGRDVD